jgi:hypothetical protein
LLSREIEEPCHLMKASRDSEPVESRGHVGCVPEADGRPRQAHLWEGPARTRMRRGWPRGRSSWRSKRHAEGPETRHGKRGRAPRARCEWRRPLRCHDSGKELLGNAPQIRTGCGGRSLGFAGPTPNLSILRAGHIRCVWLLLAWIHDFPGHEMTLHLSLSAATHAPPYVSRRPSTHGICSGISARF